MDFIDTEIHPIESPKPRRTRKSMLQEAKYNEIAYAEEILQLTKITKSEKALNKDFAKSLLDNILRGCNVSDKMKKAVDNVITKGIPSTKDIQIRDKVSLKLEALKDIIEELDVNKIGTKAEQYSAYPFITSIIEQYEKRGSLSRKQFEAVNRVFAKYKKRYNKKKA